MITPKPDVFVEDVQHVLILATPVEIILLAVVFEENREISLIPSLFYFLFFFFMNFDIYYLIIAHLAIPSDKISMLKVVGTYYGRIFLCGKDGNLYELGYQSNNGWFRKNCWKTCHTQSMVSSYVPSFLKLVGDDPLIDAIVDHQRNLLYTLSAHSCIQVFDLGSDGQGFTLVGAITNIRSTCLKLWSDAQPDAKVIFLFFIF